MLKKIEAKTDLTELEGNIIKLDNRFKVIRKIIILITLKERIARIYTKYTTPLYEPIVQFMYVTHIHQSGSKHLCVVSKPVAYQSARTHSMTVNINR